MGKRWELFSQKNVNKPRKKCKYCGSTKIIIKDHRGNTQCLDCNKVFK